MKLFIDCDILLDVGLARQPFCQASGELLDYLPRYGGLKVIKTYHNITTCRAG